MKKLIAVAGAIAAITFSGCGILDIDDDSVTINNTRIGTLTAPALEPLKGNIDANIEITDVSFSISDASGGTVPTNLINILGGNSIPTDKEKIDFEDYNIQIFVADTAYNGEYTLRISATAGTATVSKNDVFTVTGGRDEAAGTDLDETTVQLGAQGASPPSLLDADEMVAYSSTITSEVDRAKIDLIFWNSTVGGVTALRFISPSVAAGSPFDTWSNKAATEFKKVNAGNYDATTTQEELDALWGSGAGEVRVDVAQGDVVLVKTSEDAIKMVRIETLSGSGNTATISVKGKH